MMDDFERLYAPDRRNTDCVKWDTPGLAGDEMIPMWVADMDFQAPQPVRDALRSRVDHGVFGYHIPPDAYYAAFIDWERERHGYTVEREWIRFSPGVVTALYWFVHIMTDPGDACIVLTPVYSPYFSAVRDSGRKLVCCELVNTGGIYTIDFDRFERDIVQNGVKLFLLCSPHNPIGRVWTREELAALVDICVRHRVFIVSDEIHQDLIVGGRAHIPTAAVCGDATMVATLTSASKTFNLAGCANSFVILPDGTNRARFDEYGRARHTGGGDLFGYIAAEAAYRGGKEWLDEVLAIVRWNYRYMSDAFARELPRVVTTPLEGTYLAWFDFRAHLPGGDPAAFYRDRCAVAFSDGAGFGGDGAGHIRVNLATPRKWVVEAVRRIVRQAEEGSDPVDMKSGLL